MSYLLSKLYDTSLSADRRLREIVEGARSKVANYLKIPKYLLSLKYVITPLPKIYKVERIGNNNYVIRVSKVLGMFEQYTKTKFIDPIVLYLGKLKEVITHEFVHEAQDITGEMNRYSHDSIERRAHVITAQLV